MISLRSIFSYPLLARELTERAARKRTYLVRVLYGFALYTIFLALTQRAIARAAADHAGIAAIGFGHEILHSLVLLLSWSVLLLQPALMAGVLTYEKERDAFPLLRLTGMSPTKLLLEKYLAGLVPMATLLLLALPLTAITMGYGGVSSKLLVVACLVLLCTWGSVAAWALFCSAWCRSTVGALLLSYLGGTLLILAVPLTYSMTHRWILSGADLAGVTLPSYVWAAWPPEIFARLVEFQSGSLFSASAYEDPWIALLREAIRLCLPLIVAGAFFLMLGRLVVFRRASPAPCARERSLPRVWRLLSLGFGKLRPEHEDLPADDPITWRESSRSVLGRQMRFTLVIAATCLGTLALSIFLLGLYPKISGPQRLHNFALVIGCLAVVVLAVRSVNALLSEQANQTLDILFTTPLPAAEIIRQKARALYRYWALFGCMLAIVFTVQGWSEFQYVRANMFWRQLGQFWATAILALIVYPPLVIWKCLLLAACLRRRSRAMFAALLLFGVWLFAPLITLNLTDPAWREQPQLLWCSLFSPLGILSANEHDVLPLFLQTKQAKFGSVRTAVGVPWFPVAMNYLFYTGLALAARAMCLLWADRLLRR